MQRSSNVTDSRSGPADSLKVSQDGYVRMSLSTFMELPLLHFLSGLDDDPVCHTVEGGTEASISGYTEWLSTSVPTVTIGWDWRIDLATGTPRYLREGWLRTNVMIVDTDNGQDFGDEATAASVASRIDQIGWENDVSKYIAMRYA